MSDHTGIGEYSKQPRFGATEKRDNGVYDVGFFTSMYNFYKSFKAPPPAYKPDARTRDVWLREFARKEPLLMGVLNTVIDIDKNRGWNMVGGRNQVLKFTRMMHRFEAAPGLYGWRSAIATGSSSFWGTDMGFVGECGRDGRDGPLAALYNMDPTRLVLTGKNDYPLRYYPTGGKAVEMAIDDYLRVASMPNTDEKFHGLGYCAVSRCVELTQIMIAIYDYDREKLGDKMPRGLLLLSGVTQNQWDGAMQKRDAENAGEGVDYFDALAVLANASTTVDGKLLALANLPDGWNHRDWVDTLMFGYALTFGYDASEFWPVQFGAMGRGNEGTLQHEKATGKGRLDFCLGFQEQVQEQLPSSLDYFFDQRDEQGDLLHAQIFKEWSTAARWLYDAGAGKPSLLTDAQIRMLLADNGQIPRAWAPDSDVQSTDQLPADIDTPEVTPTPAGPASTVFTPLVKPSAPQNNKSLKNYREALLERASVWQAAERFPKEPIVQYRYPDDKFYQIWEAGETLFEKKVF